MFKLGAARRCHPLTTSNLSSWSLVLQASCNMTICMIVVSTWEHVAARNLEWLSSCQSLRFTYINKYLQHFPMMLYEQVPSYKRMMKCSIIVRSSVEICSSLDNLIKVSVSSGNASDVFHAIGLPRSRNCDTASQPVNGYQQTAALHTLSSAISA